MGNVVVLHCDSGNNIRLSPTVMRGSFDFAMQKPIELFTQELQRWSGLAKHHAPQVIIAGGTARSLALQQTLKALCRQYKMESPIFIDKLVARHRFVFLHVHL
ncbi:hypothetical protein IMZ48_25540 [Candidatus Bathyarchaeota archaeon]|nr:hypothetical protein [Candidatus Bathyarchaeota archaeon]